MDIDTIIALAGLIVNIFSLIVAIKNNNKSQTQEGRKPLPRKGLYL